MTTVFNMGKIKEDLVGKVFGRLTVSKRGPSEKNRCSRWYADCVCGTKNVLVRGSHLKSRSIKSCGCLHIETATIKCQKGLVDLTGKTFTYLLVICRELQRSKEKNNKNNPPIWRCLCKCGNTVFVRSADLKKNKTRSCGCYHRELMKARVGPKSPVYIDGRTPETKRQRQLFRHSGLSKQCFERDDYTCQICDARGGKLHADHIQRWADYPELRFELSNLRTLCISCHKKTPTYGGSKHK